MQGVFPNEYWASVVKDESTGDAMVGLERDLFIRVACAGVPSGEDPSGQTSLGAFAPRCLFFVRHVEWAWS